MKKKFHFVYLTTNLINHKQYVGDHSTDNINDNYLGSGKAALIPSFEKYGKQNFKREILEFFNTKEEAFNAQEKYIEKYNTLSPNGYNISPKGGLNVKGCHSKETKIKISKSEKGKIVSEESRKKLSKSLKGRIRLNESIKKQVETRKKSGFILSIDSRNKISNANKGKFLVLNKNGIYYYVNKYDKRFISGELIAGNRNKKLSKQHKQKISKKLKGRNLSDETKQKMSISHKGKLPANKGKKLSEEERQKISKGQMGRKLSQETKEKIRNTLKSRKRIIL